MFSTDMSIDRIKQMEPGERQEFVDWLISRPVEEMDRFFHCMKIRQYMMKNLNNVFVGQANTHTSATSNPHSTYTIWSGTSTSTSTGSRHYDHFHGVPNF